MPDLTREDVKRITEKLAKERLIHSCLTCEHFYEHATTMPGDKVINAETCLLYATRPPARVIAFGCDSWTDGVPF